MKASKTNPAKKTGFVNSLTALVGGFFIQQPVN